MYCIFAKESIDMMKGNRGKFSAQAGHAFLHAYWDALFAHQVDAFCQEDIQFAESKYARALEYRESEHARKITCVVPDIIDLIYLYEDYKYKPYGSTIVEDCGFTVFPKPIVTCVGLGPLRDEDIDDRLKSLKLLL